VSDVLHVHEIVRLTQYLENENKFMRSISQYVLNAELVWKNVNLTQYILHKL